MQLIDLNKSAPLQTGFQNHYFSKGGLKYKGPPLFQCIFSFLSAWPYRNLVVSLFSLRAAQYVYFSPGLLHRQPCIV